MESATLRRAPPLPAALQLGLIALLLSAAVIAWAVTDERMAAWTPARDRPGDARLVSSASGW